MYINNILSTYEHVCTWTLPTLQTAWEACTCTSSVCTQLLQWRNVVATTTTDVISDKLISVQVLYWSYGKNITNITGKRVSTCTHTRSRTSSKWHLVLRRNTLCKRWLALPLAIITFHNFSVSTSEKRTPGIPILLVSVCP